MNLPLLRKLSLMCFRSLPEAQVELSNPTFLVGKNGSGKSNLVDSLAFIAESMSSPLSAVFDRRGGFASVETRQFSRGKSVNLAFKVELHDLNEETRRADYGFEVRRGQNYDIEVVREQCVVVKRDNVKNWFDRSSSHFESSPGSFALDLGANSLALPLIGGDRRFGAVTRFLSEMRVYRLEPDSLRKMQNPDGGTRLNFDGSNIASVLREIKSASSGDWESICSLLENIVPRTIDVRPKKHGTKLSLEFIQQWSDSRRMKFEALNMSDGTLRALGLLASVFQNPAPSLLALEEPETTIHPGAFGSILDLLRHASRSMQVVVATNSPDILDAKWLEDHHLRIVDWDQGRTSVRRVSKAVRNAMRERLMGAGELLRANALTSESTEPRELAPQSSQPTLLDDIVP